MQAQWSSHNSHHDLFILVCARGPGEVVEAARGLAVHLVELLLVFLVERLRHTSRGRRTGHGQAQTTQHHGGWCGCGGVKKEKKK